jgi:hypothetical protein
MDEASEINAEYFTKKRVRMPVNIAPMYINDMMEGVMVYLQTKLNKYALHYWIVMI